MKQKLNKGLIISCQAVKGEPLWNCNIMHLMARAAVEGGAKGIRCQSEDIKSIRDEVDVPIIGLIKQHYDDSEIYITPTIKEIDELIAAKPDVIAMDATLRSRPNNITLEALVGYVREKAPEISLMADISTYEEALNAKILGFDYISTTMRSYTDYTKNIKIPDYKFIKKLKKAVPENLIVEGGIWEIKQLKKIIKINPYAVVIGSAVTRPKEIVKYFNSVMAGSE